MRVFVTASETAIKMLAERGVKTSIVRLSQVHDTHKQGAVSPAVQVAREKGKSAYVAEGKNRWAAVHVSDVARLYRLALERAEPGASHLGSDDPSCIRVTMTVFGPSAKESWSGESYAY